MGCMPARVRVRGITKERKSRTSRKKDKGTSDKSCEGQEEQRKENNTKNYSISKKGLSVRLG